MKLCLVIESESFRDKGLLLSSELNIPLLDIFFSKDEWKKLKKTLSQQGFSFEFALIYDVQGLSLISLDAENFFSPVFVDFGDGAWKRRLSNISAKKELAAKALGLTSKQQNSEHCIFDANAGLGQDLFVFASLGARVQACERSSVVFVLLQDALERAHELIALKEIVERVSLTKKDSISVINEGMEEVTAIYLDPMFPETKQSALAKKEMQVFQALVGEDADAVHLLQTSLNHLYSQNACSRVVLKRPRLAPVLEPDYLSRQLIGNATRFDIYFAS